MDDLNEEDLEEVSWQAAKAALSLRRMYPDVARDVGGRVSSEEVPKGRRGAGSRAESALLDVLSDRPLLADEQGNVSEARTRLLDTPEGRLRFSADLLALVADEQGDPASKITTAPPIQRVLMHVVDSLIDNSRLGDDMAVLDIACGSGVLLAKVADRLERETGRSVVAYGSDVNVDVMSVAKAFLDLAGRDAHLKTSDVLSEDAFPGMTADFIVSDLPLNLMAHDKADAGDPRFPFGAPRSNASLAFVQAMVSKLRPPEQGGGIAVALIANTPLHAPDQVSAEIRTALVDADLLRAVILLPERLMRTTGVAVNLVVLDNAKPKAWRGKVQFVDLRSQFIDSDQLVDQRSINAEGLEELGRALRRPKPSRNVRTFRNEDLRFRDVRLGFVPAGVLSRSVRSSFTVRIPAHVEASEWCERRYQNHEQFEMITSSGIFASWDPAPVFDSASLDKTLKSQKERWRFRSCVGLVADFRLLPSDRSQGRGEGAEYLMGPHSVLVLPLAHTGLSRVFEQGDELPSEQALLIRTVQSIDVEFIAGWLNTENGRTARRAAENARRYIKAVRTESDALQYLDRLQVPLPDLTEQKSLSAALSILDAARSDVDLMQTRLWESPETEADVRDQVGVWLSRTERLHSWIDSLPFPLASSLWTYVSVGSHRESVEQLIHVFEAFSQFHATHMIAALHQDPSLWKSLVPRLRTMHRANHLSFALATFATWRSTSDFIAAEFRRGLNGDDVEQAGRYLALLGDPSPAGVQRLLGPDLSQVLAKVNTLRNKWVGHTGAVSPGEAQSRHERLREHLIELRNALGYGWGGLQLIRAGSSTFDGASYNYRIELLQGVRTPFEPSFFNTERALITDGLYLVSDTGGCLEVPGFVRMGPDPEAADNTCYFYNRLEDSGAVRVVTYQRADVGAMERTDVDLSRLVAELDWA